MTTPRVLRVVRCRQCGYDLQGISLESRCPECGENAADGITAALLLSAGDVVPLRLSNRRWIRLLRCGLGATVLGAGLLNVMSARWLVRNPFDESSRTLSLVILTAATLSIGTGAGLLSLGEPNTGGPPPVRRARFLIRLGFVVFVLIALAPMAFPPSPPAVLLRVYPIVLRLIALLTTIPALHVAAVLARRSSRPRLAHLSLVCIGAVIVAAVGELYVGSVPIGSHVNMGVTQFPLIADATTLGAFFETERYRSRIDVKVVLIAFNAIVSLGVTAIWAQLWWSIAKPRKLSVPRVRNHSPKASATTASTN